MVFQRLFFDLQIFSFCITGYELALDEFVPLSPVFSQKEHTIPKRVGCWRIKFQRHLKQQFLERLFLFRRQLLFGPVFPNPVMYLFSNGGVVA